MSARSMTTIGAAGVAVLTLLALPLWGVRMSAESVAVSATTHAPPALQAAPQRQAPAPAAPPPQAPKQVPKEATPPPAESPQPAAAPEPSGDGSAASRAELAELVVMIRGTLEGTSTIGAGVIFSRAGDLLHIVTGNHVVRSRPELGSGQKSLDAQDIEVQFHWLRGEWHPARLLDFENDDLDVAVLRVRGAQALSVPQLPWASLVRPDTISQGEAVFPMGYSAGEPWFVPQRSHYVATVGTKTIRTEGDLLAGSSGGGLATDDWGIAGLVRTTGSMFNESSRIDLVTQQLENWGLPLDLKFKARRKASSRASEADPAATLARDRQNAEGLVARGLGALLAENAQAFVELIEVPFYFDQEIVLDREDLRLRLSNLFQNRTDRETPSIKSIRASTVGELRAQEPDLARDRVMVSLSMTDADWRVLVVMGQGSTDRRESVVFFVRKVDGAMKIVGMWD